jgi:hypothetical protein
VLSLVLALLAIATTARADDVPFPGSISGSVVDKAGNPIDRICVDADSDISVPQPVGYSSYSTGRSGTDGRYRIGSLAPGNYKLRFHECSIIVGAGEPRRYLAQYYSGKQTASEADPVFVLAAETRDINVSMVARTGISGRVLETSGWPAAGVCVSGDGRGARTDELGRYRMLPDAGDVTVSFRSCDGNMLYQTQFYDSASTLESATAVRFIQGVETLLRDQTILRRPAIVGRVHTSSGDTLAGICVSTLQKHGQSERRTARTNEQGFYELRLPDGDYKIQFYACNEWGAYISRYQHNYYRNAFDVSSAETVHFAGLEVRLQDTILFDRP